MIYPYQIYDTASKSLRADIHVDAGLPPTFIAQMGDDTGSLAQGSTLLYLDLVNRKIPAELHIYEGGHGFGMRPCPEHRPTDKPQLRVDWLKLHGYIAAVRRGLLVVAMTWSCSSFPGERRTSRSVGLTRVSIHVMD